jgi:predicted nucleic acid-binding protein
VDTSFLVSLYVPDAHTKKAIAAIANFRVLPLSPLHRAEWLHAIGQHVFRGLMSAQDAVAVHRELERDRNAGFWRHMPMPGGVFDTCIALSLKYTAKLGTRTLDTLHVAAALETKASEFWTFDRRQMQLAEAEGLKALAV